MARLLPLLLCAIAIAVAGCGDDDSEAGSSSSGSAEKTEAAREPSDAGPAECKDVDAPRPKPDGGAKKPSSKLDAGKTYEVDVATSCGDITIRLDQKTSPRTAASFAALARGFYDDTVFHRIVPGFVIQGGDPTGTGTGGPGYSVRDEPPADAATEAWLRWPRPPRAARHLRQPVLHRDRSRRRPAAGLRAARRGHRGPRSGARDR